MPPAHVRVTACIESDKRLSHQTSRRDVAPLGRDVVLTLDLDDRFHDRRICHAGAFKSRWFDEHHFTIVGIGADQIIVDGDCQEIVLAAGELVVLDVAGAEGRYKVSAASFVTGPQTVITITETLTSGLFPVTASSRIAINTEEEVDADRLKAFCEEARNNDDGAEVAASLVIKGHDCPEYQIGNLVSGLDPRGLDLNAYHSAAAIKRFPQVVSIVTQATSDNQQRTELILERFDAQRSQYWDQL